jgi:hypothetical protein
MPVRIALDASNRIDRQAALGVKERAGHFDSAKGRHEPMKTVSAFSVYT